MIEQRQDFIKNFWLDRDPTPGTPANEFKDEYDRRVAYANEHFTTQSGIPGSQTDRGKMYILNGPPDEIVSHPSGGTYYRPAEQGGGVTSTFPFETWRYRHIWLAKARTWFTNSSTSRRTANTPLNTIPAQNRNEGKRIPPREDWEGERGESDPLCFSLEDFSPGDAVVFPEFGKQGNADQHAGQADHSSGHNRKAVG